MKKKEQQANVYRLVTVLMAPDGSYFTDNCVDEWMTYYPAMYVSVWQDQDGMVYTIPLFGEELSECMDLYDNDIQYFVEKHIQEHRTLQRCLTCSEFIMAFKGKSRDYINATMEDICEYVISGEIKTTPELREYFKSGEWGNLRTVENDGTLHREWEKELTPDGLYPAGAGLV